jgi:ubiquinol-cytochrome c reductase cytochrome b subunit
MGGVPPEGPLAMLRNDPETRGPELFDKHCAGCHTLKGHGSEKDRNAPVLDGWSTEAWILEMLHDPDGDTRFGRTPYKGEMPSMDVPPKDDDGTFKPMPREEMTAVAKFLWSEGLDAADAKPDGLDLGKKIVTTRCTACHTYGGEGDEGGTGLAPELKGYGSLAWVKAQIANPSSKATYRDGALDPARKGHMPAFEAEMSATDVDLLARWVRWQARGAPLRTP